MESLGLDLNKGLIPYIKYIHLVVLLLVLVEARLFKPDRDEIWQDCSSSRPK